MLERGVLGIRLAITTKHPCESSADLIRRQLTIAHRFHLRVNPSWNASSYQQMPSS